jgi:exopolyphosphatase/guanosine-5'-triphosphate,3'-diphosphate pyrophosphatase
VPARLAVVDIGSNTMKFSITDVDDAERQTVIYADAETVRLGAGVATTGLIEAGRIARAMEALRSWESVARNLRADVLIGVATAALRQARNGSDLLDAIERTTGWNVRVITGTEEARLAFAGLASALPDVGTAVLVDIGGGSTELIGVRDRIMTASESIPIGSGTLADETFRADPPGALAVRLALDRANAALAGSAVLPQMAHPLVVFSGGNGQFLRAFCERTEISIPFRAKEFHRVLDAIAGVESAVLAGYLGIAQERARMLPAGAALAMAVIAGVAPTSIAAMPSGIRGGVVSDWIAART